VAPQVSKSENTNEINFITDYYPSLHSNKMECNELPRIIETKDKDFVYIDKEDDCIFSKDNATENNGDCDEDWNLVEKTQFL